MILKILTCKVGRIIIYIYGITHIRTNTRHNHTLRWYAPMVEWTSYVQLHDYPGLNNNSKSHLYSSICLPTLTYGIQCVSLSSPDKLTRISAQGGILKQMCGISKGSRHINLQRAMNWHNVSTMIGNYTKSVFKRVYCH